MKCGVRSLDALSPEIPHKVWSALVGCSLPAVSHKVCSALVGCSFSRGLTYCNTFSLDALLLENPRFSNLIFVNHQTLVLCQMYQM